MYKYDVAFVNVLTGADLDKYPWGGKRVAGDFEGWHPLAEVYADLIAVRSINVNLESHNINILTQ